MGDVRETKRLAKKPLLIGSGTTIENAASLLEFADGIIIGTGLKKDGVMENEVDPVRVRQLMDQVRPVRDATTASRKHSAR
jgi:predicted TIM-barrel enzyme